MNLAAQVSLYAADVCPVAPPGMATWADTITGWVKWVVIAGIGVAFFVSLGLMLWGKFMEHHKSAKIGVTALIVVVLVAILCVGGYVIIDSIVGAGC